MATISGAVRTAVCGSALILMALPGVSAAAEHGGMPHGDHGGMKMEGHDGRHGKTGAHDMGKGEKIFHGKLGPWTGEARLIDMQAQMEQSGVSSKIAARFAGERHLMLFLTDPATGKPAAGMAGKVVITGPDQASSSKGTLVVMGGHIGVDVGMPTPGEYMFTVDVESADGKGSATFSYTLK